MKKFLTVFVLLFSSLSLLEAQKLKLVHKKFPNSEAIKFEYTVLKKQAHVKHGDYKAYYPNGQEKEIGFYHYNSKTGDWKEYSSDGKIKRIRIYNNGKLESDIKNGVWQEIDKNGNIRYFDYDKKEWVLPPIPPLPKLSNASGRKGNFWHCYNKSCFGWTMPDKRTRSNSISWGLDVMKKLLM